MAQQRTKSLRAAGEPPNFADLRTPSQLAAKYPLSVDAIYTACKDGLIRHYRLPSKRGRTGKYAIREADFIAWIESCVRGVDEVEEETEFRFIKKR